MQSKIQFTPSQIQSQGSNALTQVVDTVGNPVVKQSLVGDLAQGIQAAMPGVEAWAAKQQKQFVQDAQNAGIKKQMENPLAAPDKSQATNGYEHDARLEVWATARGADIASRREALANEILKDPERLPNWKSEMDKFDQEELAGLNQVDSRVAASIYPQLLKQHAQLSDTFNNAIYKQQQAQALSDLRTTIATVANEPSNPQSVMDTIMAKASTAGVPRDKAMEAVIESIDVALSRGDPQLVEHALNSWRDPRTQQPLEVEAQRYGMGEKVRALRGRLDSFYKEQKTEAERSRNATMDKHADEFKLEVSTYERSGVPISQEWVASKVNEALRMQKDGLVDTPRARAMIESIPKAVAANMATVNAAEAFSSGGHKGLKEAIAFGNTTAEEAMKLNNQRNSQDWNTINQTTDPKQREVLMKTLLSDIVTQVQTYPKAEIPFVTDVLHSFKTGQVFDATGKPKPGQEANAAFLQMVMTDKDYAAVVNAMFNKEDDVRVLQHVGRLMKQGVPAHEALTKAQEILSNPIKQDQLRRAMGRPRDEIVKLAETNLVPWYKLGRDSITTQENVGSLWLGRDQEFNPKEKTRVISIFEDYARTQLFNDPTMTDEELVSKFNATKANSTFYDLQGGFVWIPPENFEAWNANLRRQGKQPVSRDRMQDMIGRVGAVFKGKVQETNPNAEFHMEAELGQNGRMMLYVVSSDGRYSGIDMEQIIARDNARITAENGSSLFSRIAQTVGGQMQTQVLDFDKSIGNLLKAPSNKGGLDHAIKLASDETRAPILAADQRAKAQPVRVPDGVAGLVRKNFQSRNPRDITAAAIIGMESYVSNNYADAGNGGLNIGFGVNLPNQSDSDLSKVARELGLPDSPEVIAELRQGKVRNSPTGKATLEQSETILKALIPKYESRAIDTLANHPKFGGNKDKAREAWAQMDAGKRAALTILSWNGGGNLPESQHKAYDLLMAGRPQDIKGLHWTYTDYKTKVRQRSQRPLDYAANVATDPTGGLFITK